MIRLLPHEDLEKRRVYKRDSQGSLWYVRPEPEPATLTEKVVAWVVKRFTPQWDVIQSVRRVDLPLSTEEAGAYLAARQETWEHPETRVSILQIPLEEKLHD